MIVVGDEVVGVRVVGVSVVGAEVGAPVVGEEDTAWVVGAAVGPIWNEPNMSSYDLIIIIRFYTFNCFCYENVSSQVFKVLMFQSSF